MAPKGDHLLFLGPNWATEKIRSSAASIRRGATHGRYGAKVTRPFTRASSGTSWALGSSEGFASPMVGMRIASFFFGGGGVLFSVRRGLQETLGVCCHTKG